MATRGLVLQNFTPDDFDNFVLGGPGTPVSPDNISGFRGDDTILGAGGNDTINGDDGDDEIHGGSGNDRLNGGLGDDLISGGEGNDGTGPIISMAPNAPGLFGEGGDDTLMGGEGNDGLDGGPGDDVLRGGSGNDVLNGSSGSDIYTGGTGSDTFLWNYLEFGFDTITDFMLGADTILVQSLSTDGLIARFGPTIEIGDPGVGGVSVPEGPGGNFPEGGFLVIDFLAAGFPNAGGILTVQGVHELRVGVVGLAGFDIGGGF